MKRKHRALGREEHIEVLRKLRRARSVEDAVLRGHLYLEYWLNELILREWKKGELIVKQFSFMQRLQIADAASIVGEPEFIPCLRAVNEIRNRFAHELDPAGIEAQLVSLPIPFQGGKEKSFALSGLHRFVFVVELMSAFMLGVCEKKDGVEESESLLPALLRN